MLFLYFMEDFVKDFYIIVNQIQDYINKYT